MSQATFGLACDGEVVRASSLDVHEPAPGLWRRRRSLFRLMRLLFLTFHFFCRAAPMPAQWLSFGAKGGLPLTAASDAGYEGYRYGGRTSFQLKRYTLGPTVEIGLPWGLRLEADALYKHARQDRFSGPAPSAVLNQEGMRIDIWEITLLMKYRWKVRGFRPFATAGSTLRRIEDLDVDLISIPTVPNFPATRQHFSVSSGEPIRYGVSLGGGLTWNLSGLRLEPELRYTHWTARHWMATTEQIELFVGVTVPVSPAK